MILWSIVEDLLRGLLIGDAAFDPKGIVPSQHCWIVAFTTPKLAAGERDRVSIMAWKSRRLHRQAASSLLNETLAYSKGVSALLWIMSLDRSLRFTGWKHGDPLFPSLQVEEAPTVLSRKARMVVGPATQGVIDAKSLFDTPAASMGKRLADWRIFWGKGGNEYEELLGEMVQLRADADEAVKALPRHTENHEGGDECDQGP